MTERHISHSDNTRQQEAKAVEGEQNMLRQAQAHGGTPGAEALAGKSLMTTYQHWEKQFASLPHQQGHPDKLDTKAFTP